MQNPDLLSLDGRSLRVFLTVYEEVSVSKAAERLELTQSTVSHVLDKLRLGLGDPLFVRYGRGITPTERAVQLHSRIKNLVDDLYGLLDDRHFDPTQETLDFTIAANDFQRDYLFPSLFARAMASDIDLRLHFVPSGVPKQRLLYEAHCDLVVTPRPPDGQDILQQRLFDTRHVCYFDPKVRQAPATLEEYLACRHASVTFEDHASSWDTLPPQLNSDERIVVISVPNFSALPKYIVGTDIIATELKAMHQIMDPLEFAPTPFAAPKKSMYMSWHRRDHLNPAHMWLREEIRAVAQSVSEEP